MAGIDLAVMLQRHSHETDRFTEPFSGPGSNLIALVNGLADPRIVDSNAATWPIQQHARRDRRFIVSQRNRVAINEWSDRRELWGLPLAPVLTVGFADKHEGSISRDPSGGHLASAEILAGAPFDGVHAQPRDRDHVTNLSRW